MRTQFVTAVTIVAGVCAGVAGCGSNPQPAPSHTSTTAGSPTSTSTPTAPPNAVGVSPGGVTTKVDVPSEATESQYGQACHAAHEWMVAQHVDPTTLVEPYLKTLQQPGATGPGTFDTTWAKLTRAQQAGVIMAADQASRGECG